MDAMIKLAFERMNQQLTELTEYVKELKGKVLQLEKEKQKSSSAPVLPETPARDELITIKAARAILGISRNTFNAMIERGLFKAIRLNQRTIRYSRAEIQYYIAQNTR